MNNFNISADLEGKIVILAERYFAVNPAKTEEEVHFYTLGAVFSDNKPFATAKDAEKLFNKEVGFLYKNRRRLRTALLAGFNDFRCCKNVAK